MSLQTCEATPYFTALFILLPQRLVNYLLKIYNVCTVRLCSLFPNLFQNGTLEITFGFTLKCGCSLLHARGEVAVYCVTVGNCFIMLIILKMYYFEIFNQYTAVQYYNMCT